MTQKNKKMTYYFDVELAKKYGVDGAIMLGHFEFWIYQNKKNHKNFYDGRTWTYDSVDSFSKIWPFWKSHHIYREIKKLVIEHKILIEGNYNRTAFDRTKWYAFKDEISWFLEREAILQKHKMEDSKIKNPNRTSRTPIPNPNTEVNTDKNQVGNSSDKKENLEMVLAEDKAIVEKKQLFLESLYRIFGIVSEQELKTFSKIINYLVECCHNGKHKVDIFDKAISWMKEAKQDGFRPKALFVHIMKERTGFTASKDFRKSA